MAAPRARKTDIVAAYNQLEAKYEAELARVQGLRSDLDAAHLLIADLRSEVASLEASYRSTVHDMVLVANRGELLARCKQLTQQGLPCHMQGDVIKHRQTGAVLVQIRPS
jgi:hypothetical protein